MYQITINDIPLALRGDKLLEAMEHIKEGRKPIAEGLLYENTTLMVASDPGCGKSTISLQAAVELSAGVPVFGFFQVPKPVKVLYVQCERTVIEPLERLRIINEFLPIVKENLVITDEYQKLDFMRDNELLMKCINRDCPDVEMVFFDPIYSTILGGLSEDKVASVFTKIMSRIHKTFNCSHWYNHHTVKSQYSRDGGKITKDDPFYGSQWLKAHVTGSYHMENTKEGVELTCKKDNYNLLTKSILLEYNPETSLVSMDRAHLAPLDKLKNYLRSMNVKNESFTFKQIQASTQLCTRTLRSLLMHNTIKKVLNVEKSLKNKYLYSVNGVEF